jgi:acetyl-CoA acetyltransferase
MSQDIAIIGVGLHPFGRHDGVSALAMGVKAANLALADAGLRWTDMQFATAGSLEVVQPDNMNRFLGLTGIPFTTVFNGCATGGSLLLNAANTILAGNADIGIAIGLDKHPRGALSAGDDMSDYGLGQWYGETGLALTTQYFALKTRRYLYDHGMSDTCLHLTAVKAFENGARNPSAWRRKALPYDAIANSTLVSDPLRQYHFCSPSEGAAAVVVCRSDLARRYTTSPVTIRANVFKTRRYGSFEVMAPSLPVNAAAPSPTVIASREAYETAGMGPEDIDVIQLQDTEAGHELMHMAESGFCKDGEQEALLREGATRIEGRLPINTDGGLLANGEPVGASGLRQIHELVLQLRGKAGARQVPKRPKTGYAQVYGAPGLACVTILSN